MMAVHLQYYTPEYDSQRVDKYSQFSTHQRLDRNTEEGKQARDTALLIEVRILTDCSERAGTAST